MSDPIRVLICDDHPLVLEGIRSVLETYGHIQVVGAVGSAEAALALAQTTAPDVVMLDINMPQLSGLDAVELFRERLPNARLLMLSMHDSREYISTAVMYGASGYILKDVSTGEIVSAIETVAAGGSYFSSGVADVLLQRRGRNDAAMPLTTREQAVLLLLARGKSNKDVAVELDISVRTVETHRKNIKKKLGIATTAGLTRYVIDNGLIGAGE
ncbi:LuxR family transcriptional regulator [Devosia geojensis]|uniref:LuxR family transcriptional regulator n=1 Tax=Devosia geojensis TaxID=443610 RepID=A0A0F5FV31_9HYPH|nr:response regulator transcription factor [Devosia geojensis]KKB12435.1 LuxR family transcriptional regulator [Devosia geojensis]